MTGTAKHRPGLDKTLDMLRDGDTLIIWKLDRLGRSVKNLVDLVTSLEVLGRLGGAEIQRASTIFRDVLLFLRGVE